MSPIIRAAFLALASGAASAASLPPGVTLAPIDGGAAYYASNGFTYAANAGWDNPAFFPVGPWLDRLNTQAGADLWHDVGWNTAFGQTSDSSPAIARANGIWFVHQANEAPISGMDWETVGLLTHDEPVDYASQIAGPIKTTPNSIQDGRFWWLNNTISVLYYGGVNVSPGNHSTPAMLYTPVATPNGTTRHIDAWSVDDYLFAGAHSTNPGLTIGSHTIDQVARGSNYGSLIDTERSFTNGTTPLYAYIEDGGPYSQDTTAASYITPPELNWAVWSSLIHGARGIIYFNHSFAGPGFSFQNVESSYYQRIQPGQSISIYNQVKATDALIAQMAPVLNSPTALGYATVNNPGYENGVTQSKFSGIEVTAKYSSDGLFYLLTDTRESEGATGIPATFTLADKNASSAVVIGENRTIPIMNGVFSDAFAIGAAVHLYRVCDPSGASLPIPGCP